MIQFDHVGVLSTPPLLLPLVRPAPSESKEAVSVNQRAYEYICEYVVQNKNKFCGSSEITEVLGRLQGTPLILLEIVFLLLLVSINLFCLSHERKELLLKLPSSQIRLNAFLII